MVDLGHLAQNAEGLIGESKAQIEKHSPMRLFIK